MNSHLFKPRRPFKLLAAGVMVLVLVGAEAISYALERQAKPVEGRMSVLLAQFGGFGKGGGQSDQGDNGGDQSDEPPPPPRRKAPRKGPSQRTPRQQPPKRGALDQLVQRTVGDFELKGAQRDTSAIQQGAIDAVQLQYENSEGVPLAHYLLAVQSPDQATQGAGVLAQNIEQKLELSGEGDVKTSEGEVVGHVWVFHGQKGEEVVLWTHSQLIAMAGSAEGYAVQFMKDLPY